MNSDTKAIMDAIMADSDDPVGALVANLGEGGLPPGVGVCIKRRPRSDSSSSLSPEEIARIMRQFGDMQETESNKAGPSTPPATNNEPEGDQEDGVIKRVKNGKLSGYEKELLDAIVNTAEIEATFDSVCLPQDTIDTIRSMVQLPLLYPDEFQTGILRQHMISGALLFGPPGTGKTLLAKALAKDSGARMISVKPSDILHKCVGESERLVKALFSLARKLKPCVVFIDEIDALFGARTHAGEQTSARWHTSMLTEFMQEMDGLLSSQVIVLGATNRPQDLDDAVIRRLPCRIMVGLPEQESRLEILRVLLQEEALAKDVSLEDIAKRTPRYSGSDLKNLCLAAALNAVKENADLPWKCAAKTDPHSKGKAPAHPQPFKQPKQGEPTGPEAEFENGSANCNKTPVATSRIIANRHFTRALNEVLPSSSTDTQSSKDMLNWNNKFGSGAHRSAFGIGSGLGGGLGVPPFTPGAMGSGVSYTHGQSGASVPSYLSHSREENGFGSSSGGGLSGEGASRFASGGGFGYGSAGLGGSGIGGSGVGAGGLGASGLGSSSLSGLNGMGASHSTGGLGGASAANGTSGMNGTSSMNGMGGGMGATNGVGGMGGVNGIGGGMSSMNGIGGGMGSVKGIGGGMGSMNGIGGGMSGMNGIGGGGGMNGMGRIGGMNGIGGMGGMNGIGGGGGMNGIGGMSGLGSMGSAGGMGGLGGISGIAGLSNANGLFDRSQFGARAGVNQNEPQGSIREVEPTEA